MAKRQVSIRLGRRSAVLTSAEGTSAELPLNRPCTLIGSGQMADARLESPGVETAHALVLNADGRVLLRDLASRSGVWVNRRRVREAELENGDQVQIGPLEFQFAAGPVLPSEQDPPPLVELRASGKTPGVVVRPPVFVIGRRREADLVLDDPAVSAVHAALFSLSGLWVLRDLGSELGIRINNQQRQQVALRSGYRIQLGKSTFTIVPSAPAADPGPPVQTPRPTAAEEPSSVPWAQAQSEAARPQWLKELPLALAVAATDQPADTELAASEPPPVAASRWGWPLVTALLVSGTGVVAAAAFWWLKLR